VWWKDGGGNTPSSFSKGKEPSDVQHALGHWLDTDQEQLVGQLLYGGVQMKEIHIWEVDGENLANIKIQPVENVDQTQTEQLLEEILVKRPDLLLPDLRIVGRQTDTPGGPLDLLGVDGDGRLVVFELKRGTLTRDAVAQIIDYASYLYELDTEELSIHISERSGKWGLPKIDNFLNWYTEQFARSFNNNHQPRLILVGLGADDKARRMVSFLANSDLDVSLITFYGFKQEGKILLARQLEVEAKQQVTSSGQKTSNLEKLKERITRLAVNNYYPNIAKFFQEQLAAAVYEWPNPSGFTYYLAEVTESGNQSNRAYVSLYLNDNKPGMVQIYFHARAIDAVISANPSMKEQLPIILKIAPSGYGELWVKSSEDWTKYTEIFNGICTALLEGWKLKREVGEEASIVIETIEQPSVAEEEPCVNIPQ
jgi:hypothetical protein